MFHYLLEVYLSAMRSMVNMSTSWFNFRPGTKFKQLTNYGINFVVIVNAKLNFLSCLFFWIDFVALADCLLSLSVKHVTSTDFQLEGSIISQRENKKYDKIMFRFFFLPVGLIQCISFRVILNHIQNIDFSLQNYNSIFVILSTTYNGDNFKITRLTTT